MDTGVLERLALALAIGLLIGIERGWAEREGPKGSRTAGIRTFTLIGLLGGIMGAMVPMAGSWPLALVGLGFSAAFAAFAWREAVADNSFSITSTVAGILTYALGAFAVLGDVTAAGAAGVAVAGLLAVRTPLHDFVKRLSWQELRSAILLLAMTFILLPLLPREPIDPWGTVSPYEVWLLVILIASLSFAGYVAVRLMGEKRGLAMAAAAGALVSSTAVTLNNARLARQHNAHRNALAGSITLAWTISLVRMTALACTLNYALLIPLGLPVAGAVLVLSGATLVFFLRDGKAENGQSLKLSNPFELKTVVVFGVLLALVLPLSALISAYFGTAGLFTFAAVSGLVDVDPIVLSAARLAGTNFTVTDAALTILIAGTANITAKSVIAISAGGARFGLPLGVAGLVALGLGLGVWLAAVHFAPGLMALEPNPLCCGPTMPPAAAGAG